jgi:predicted ester cyclase
MDIRGITDQFFKAHEGNLASWEDVYSPDLVVHIFPFPDTRGLKANKQASTALHQGLSDLRVEWEETIINDNKVACRQTFYARHTGSSPMLPVLPTGKEIIGRACVVFHVDEGKITEEFWYMDFLGLFQQLGVIPPMA